MLKEAFEWIRQHGGVIFEERDGRFFADRPLHEFCKPEFFAPGFVSFERLSGFSHFVNNLDFGADAFVIVESPRKVEAFRRFDPSDKKPERVLLASAQYKDPSGGKEKTDIWMEQEKFLIWVATQFVNSAERERLLKIASSVTSEMTSTSEDDGISQVSSIKTAVKTNAKVKIDNPFTLALFRTWPEVQQPDALYLLRKKVEGGNVALSLFDVAGESWAIPAVGNIVKYLREKIEDSIPIYG